MVGQDVAAYLYPALAIPSLLLCIPPFIVQARLRHFPAIVLVASVLGLNLQNVLNAFIWPGWSSLSDTWDGRIYCDIQIRFYSGLPIAIAGSVACLFKHLASAVRTDRVGNTATKCQRIWKWAFNLTLCVLFPAIAMSTIYVTSFARYSISPIIGCTLQSTFDWPTFVLQLMWIPINAFLASCCCAVTIFRLVHHRRQVSGMIALSGVNRSRYIRLFLVSFSALLCLLPLSLMIIFEMILTQPNLRANAWVKPHPPDWADNIYRVFWQNLFRSELGLRWVQIVLGYPIFAVLGLGKDARPLYQATLLRCVKRKSNVGQELDSNNVQNVGSITHPNGGDGRGPGVVTNPTHRMDDIERELWLLDNEGDLGDSQRSQGFDR